MHAPVATVLGSIPARVSPFRLKKIFAYKRNKANLDPFHMCFTISLLIFTSLFSLLFAYFRFKFFASLHLSNFCFEGKQSEAKFKSIFRFFSLFFAIFSIFSNLFRFKFFASRRFSNFCFEANKAKRNSSLFFRFFAFFHFFSHFFAFFSLFFA